MNRAHELYPPIAGWTPQSRIMTVDEYVHYVACKSKYLSPRTLQKIIRIATRNGLTCSYRPYEIVSCLFEFHRGDTLRYLICRYEVIDEAFKEYVADADRQGNHTGIIWHHPRMYHDDYMRTFMIDRYYDLVAPYLSSVDLHALIASANIFGTFMTTRALRVGERERLPYPEPSLPQHRCSWRERTCITISDRDDDTDHMLPYNVRDERHRRAVFDNMPLCNSRRNISAILDRVYESFSARDVAYVMTLTPVHNIKATGMVMGLAELHRLGCRFDFWEDMSLIGTLLSACHGRLYGRDGRVDESHMRRDEALYRFIDDKDDPRYNLVVFSDHFYWASDATVIYLPDMYRIADIPDMWDILRVNRESIKAAINDEFIDNMRNIPSNIFKYLHLPPLRIYADDFVDVAQLMTEKVAAMIYDTKAVFFYELCVRSGHVDASVINPANTSHTMQHGDRKR